jgi:hypothetical protein
MSMFENVMALAEHFLYDYDVIPPGDHRAVVDRIAQRIQTGIEDDLSDLYASGKIRERVRTPALHGIERPEQRR